MARRTSSPILVGREVELRACELALQEALDGRPGLILIGGEAGVGKSRLVAESASRARDAGGLAALGSAPPPSGTERVPLAAIAQALRSLLRAVDARLIDSLLGPARGDLAALLPELGTAPHSGADGSPFVAARLAEAVLVAVESVSLRHPPLLLALEDLHWADEATLATVMHLCRNVADAPVVLALTFRSDGLPIEEGFLDFLAEVGRTDGTERLDLEPLGRERVAEQMRSILGSDPPPELVAAIGRRSGGIPFYVEELLIETVRTGAERPPPSVRASVEARLARLSATAHASAQALAIAGNDVPSRLISDVTGTAWPQVSDALEELRDAHLVEADVPLGDAAAARARIRHVLVAEAIVETIAPSLRQDLHARFASAIERRPELAGTTELEQTSRLASHLVSSGQPARAVPALLGEAAAAESARVFEAAARAYRQALDAWGAAEADEGVAIPDRGIVLERAAHAASLAGRSDDAVAWAQAALAGARAAAGDGDAERIARLTMHLGRFQAETGQMDVALTTVQAAAAESPSGSRVFVRSRILLAHLLSDLRRPTEALDQARIAVDAAEAIGASTEAAQARSAQAAALAALGRTEEALAVIDAAASREAGSGPERTMPSRPSRLIADLHGHLDRAIVLEQAGDLAAAAAAAQAGAAEARRRGLANSHGSILAAVAARDLVRLGEWEAADRLVDDVAGTGGTAPEATLVRAHLAALRGDWTQAEDELAAAGSDRAAPLELGWSGYAFLVLAEMSSWRRRFLEARHAVRSGLAAASTGEAADLIVPLAAAGIRVEADAASAGSRKRAVSASAAEELASSHWIRISGEQKASGGSPRSPRDAAIVATARADLERFRGASSSASWTLAREAWQSAGDPYEAARASRWLAEALLAEGGDRGAARDALRAAMDTADVLGAIPLARETERLARRARLAGVGVSDVPRPASGVAASGEAQARDIGLSPREIEVLGLIAEGLTDREIGERLFITTKTAGHHVSHILTKLAVDRRGEAAAVAYRIGLVEASD